MIYRMNFFSIVGSILLLLVILNLVRTKKLSEKYSILWLLSVMLMLIISMWRGLLEVFARIFGIVYPPSFLFMLAFFLGIVMALHFSIVITRLSDEQVKLSQEIALLKARLKKLEK